MKQKSLFPSTKLSQLRLQNQLPGPQLLFVFSESEKNEGKKGSLIIGDLPFATHCAAQAIIFPCQISCKYFPLQMENKGGAGTAMSHGSTKSAALWPATLSSGMSCAFWNCIFRTKKKKTRKKSGANDRQVNGRQGRRFSIFPVFGIQERRRSPSTQQLANAGWKPCNLTVPVTHLLSAKAQYHP